MKKFKFLFIMLIGILLFPCSALAEESSQNDPVKVYFFHGDGCSYCAKAEEFFDSIEEEYGDMFEVVPYEVWNDEDNYELMEQVAEARNEEQNGVPYIIIGNQSWDGYASSYDDEIISKIKSEYETPVDERYDIMNYVDDIYKNDSSSTEESKSYAGDIAVVIAMILIVSGVGYGIWFARKKAA